MVDAIATRNIEAVAAGCSTSSKQNVSGRLPAIGRIKAIMLQNGAWNAALSGSGACVFGLASSERVADNITAALRHEFPYAVVTQTC